MDDWDQFWVSLIRLEILWWAIILLLYNIISFKTLIGSIMRRRVLSQFYTGAMAPYHHHCGILLFYRFLFPPRGWVLPLVEITDCIRSTFLSNHIIAVYNYFVRDSYRLDGTASHSIAILSQRNGAISMSPLLIVVVFFLYLFASYSWMIVTISWDHQLHQKYFSERSYYRYIS